MRELGLASSDSTRLLLEWADVDHVVAPRVMIDGAAWDTRRDDRADHESSMTAESDGADWRLRGVRVVRADELDVNTPQTPGMNRAAAINAARAGARNWVGTVIIHPAAETVRITTVRWRASSTSSAAGQACGGGSGSNTWPKPAPAI